MRTQNTTTGAGNTTAAHTFLGLTIPQHTPGPWSLGESYDHSVHGDFEVFGAEFGHYASGRVAVVERRAGNGSFVESCNPQTQRMTAEANARLIAAAPELLAAARMANQELLDLGVGSSASPALQALWTAIAKAEGND
jgi:hypothetical protein